jgi:hypothetical protein
MAALARASREYLLTSSGEFEHRVNLTLSSKVELTGTGVSTVNKPAAEGEALDNALLAAVIAAGGVQSAVLLGAKSDATRVTVLVTQFFTDDVGRGRGGAPGEGSGGIVMARACWDRRSSACWRRKMCISASPAPHPS